MKTTNNSSLLIPFQANQSIKLPGIPQNNRWIFYLLALALKIITAIFFIDRIDGAVFTQTSKDILLNHTNIYYEGSLQFKFNYFPLVYLIYLPSMYIYYFYWPIHTLIFERIFLKLPLIIGELYLAYLFKPKNSSQKTITAMELFILFNPFILYAGSYKSQFDVFPAIMMILSWRKKQENKPVLSGVYSGAAMMLKQYSLIFSFYLWLHYLKKDKKEALFHTIGILTVFIPVLLIGAILNLHGMIYHAILFHLGRNPNGFSITVITYYSLTSILKFAGTSTSITNTIGKMILDIFSIILLLTLAYIGEKVWKLNPEKQTDLLKLIIYGFLAFYLLNKGFLLHYLAAFFPLLAQYWQDKKQKPSALLISWEIISIPLIYILRIALMIPPDIKTLIGPYWFEIMWFSLVIIHLILLGVIIKITSPKFLFPNKNYLKIYLVILLLLPVHFLVLYLVLKHHLYTSVNSY